MLRPKAAFWALAAETALEVGARLHVDRHLIDLFSVRIVRFIDYIDNFMPKYALVTLMTKTLLLEELAYWSLFWDVLVQKRTVLTVSAIST